MADTIVAYVGGNGHGKTLSLVRGLVLPWIRDGRPVLSNTPIFASPADAELPWPERQVHPLYVPLVSWRQLSHRLKDTLVVLDEISSMFDSRDSGRMPGQITSRFQQLRKDDNAIGWTAPDWDRCDKALRKVTRTVNLCKGSRSVKVEGRKWRSNRKITVRRYDRARFDEFSLREAQSTRKDTIKPEWRESYWRTRSDAQHYYDTYAPVNLLDHLDDSGRCVDCGGIRRPHKCECARMTGKRRQEEPMTLDQMKQLAVMLDPDLALTGGIDLAPLSDVHDAISVTEGGRV